MVWTNSPKEIHSQNHKHQHFRGFCNKLPPHPIQKCRKCSRTKNAENAKRFSRKIQKPEVNSGNGETRGTIRKRTRNSRNQKFWGTTETRNKTKHCFMSKNNSIFFSTQSRPLVSYSLCTIAFLSQLSEIVKQAMLWHERHLCFGWMSHVLHVILWGLCQFCNGEQWKDELGGQSYSIPMEVGNSRYNPMELAGVHTI